MSSHKRKAGEGPGELGASKAPLSAYAATARYREPETEPGSSSSSETDFEEPNGGETQYLVQPPDEETRYDSEDYEADATGSIPSRLSNVVLGRSRTLGTWKKSGQNFREALWGDSIRIEGPESLALIGYYDVQVKKGTITISGAILDSSSPRTRVWAASVTAIPVIKTLANEPAEVDIHHVDDQSIRALSKISPLFGRIWNKPENRPKSAMKRSFSYVQNSNDDPLKRQLYTLNVPDTWHAAITSIMNKPAAKVLIGGAQNGGKSTFGRLLANRLITRLPHRSTTDPNGPFQPVFWMDVDPGQPEYTHSAQVSLILLRKPNLGPTFTHPVPEMAYGNRLIKAHCIAATSPREDPEHYLSCVIDLLETYLKLIDNDFKGSPLIVNCPGWVKTQGLEVMEDMIRGMSLTHVVHIDPATAASLRISAACKPAIYHKLLARPATPPSRTAAEFRDMQSLSYFHLILPSIETNLQPTWDPSPLTWINPYEIPFTKGESSIFGILIPGEAVPDHHIFGVLNGCLVSISTISAVSALESHYSLTNRQPPPQLTWTEHGFPYFPAGPKGFAVNLKPKESQHLGFALVRGIDVKNGVMHLLTPIPEEAMAELEHDKTILVRCRMEAPGWSYLEDTHLDEHRARRDKRLEALEKARAGSSRDAAIEIDDDDEEEVMDEDGKAVEDPDWPDDDVQIPWVHKTNGDEEYGKIQLQGMRNRRFPNSFPLIH